MKSGGLKMGIAKSRMFILVTLIILTLFFVACTIPQNIRSMITDQSSIREKEEISGNMAESTKSKINYQPKEGDVIAYTIRKKEFQEFLVEPLIDTLPGFAVYKKSTSRDGYIEVKGFSANGITNYENVSGYLRIGSWPIYTEFIDFMNNPENFKQILLEHGIVEEILYYVILEHYYLEFKEDEVVPPGTGPTMCIWIHTNTGDYFLEHNAYLYEDPSETEFRYDFYNLAGYSKKYGDK